MAITKDKLTVLLQTQLGMSRQEARQVIERVFRIMKDTLSQGEDPQVALEALDTAITSKDNIRANLGALANRLANTISNLSIQAENLQAAESRISDVDVATEMTEFTRNQILAQSAVAMLAQANSLPQLALRLISG
jgi:flagellin